MLKIDAHTISTYLTFRYPDKYYMYKSSIDNKVAKFLGVNIHNRDKAEELKSYFILAERVLNYIKNDDKLLKLSMSSLTEEYYKDEELVEELKDENLVELMGENSMTEKQYFWLNANPRIWSYSQLDIGEIIEYTSENERGNKRKIYRNFLEAKKGDLVIAYESTPTKAIVGLCEVEEALNNGIIKIKKTENLINLVPYNEVKNLEEMKNAEVTKNNQGSFFKLTKTEFDSIIDLIREYNPKNQTVKAKYSKEEFLKEVYISENQYNKIINLIKRKKNIILQGAPGVGKTFMAKRLAYSIMGEKDTERIKCIQFHQSYSYEDFIEGWRPTETSYQIEKGIFYSFCKMAENDKSKEYFFIIDEINRGNLSKIFGELLMLIENDKREEKLNLTYSKVPFSVPSNVYIIGMMNTADRSLAIIDYALRRRFAFCNINPAFDSEQFKNYQNKLNSSKFNELLELIKQLNIEIEQDPTLGSGFKIGHSYFCNLENITIENIASIVEYEILPLIEEYWFDDTDKYNVWLNKLNGVING